MQFVFGWSSPKFTFLIMTYSGFSKQQICLKLAIYKAAKHKILPFVTTTLLLFVGYKYPFEPCSLYVIQLFFCQGILWNYEDGKGEKLGKDKWSVQLWRKSFIFLWTKVRNGPTPLLNWKLLFIRRRNSHVKVFYLCLSKCLCYNNSSLICRLLPASPRSPPGCSVSLSNPQQSPLVLAISCEHSLKLFWSLFRISEQQTDLVPSVWLIYTNVYISPRFPRQ